MQRAMIRTGFDVLPAWAWLSGILLLGGGLRLYDLGGVSLWNDELFSVYYPRAGEAFMWTRGLHLEPNPPLYYSILAAWMRLFGHGDATVRLPSVIASMAAIALVFRLAWEVLGSVRAAAAAAALLALAPISGFVAHEARAYAMQSAAIAAAMLGVAQFLKRPGDSRPLVLYAVAGVLSVYFHMTSALFLAAANGAVLSAALGPGRLVQRRDLVRWMAVNAGVALACLPLLPLLTSPDVALALGWIGKTDGDTLLYTLACLAGGPALAYAYPVWTAVGAVLVLAASLLLPRWRPGRLAGTVLVVLPLLALALTLGASLLRPLIMARTMAWFAVPLVLVLAAGLTNRARGRIRWAPAAAAVLLFGAMAVYQTRDGYLNEDWRGFLQTLAPRLGQPAMIVLGPGTPAGAFEDYAPSAGPLLTLETTGPQGVEMSTMPQVMHTGLVSAADIAAAIAAHRPVWLISRYATGGAWLDALLKTLPPPVERLAPDTPGVALRW